MQIIVLGMHRSGTSLTTRLINMMGAYFGPESSVGELTDDNPKGFWERPEVFKLNEAILAAKRCAWHDLRYWSQSEAHTIPEHFSGHIRKLILGMDAHRPWVLKDPRLCLLLPAWRRWLEAPIAVIVHRNPVEIAVSLQKRDKMPIEQGIDLWEQYAQGILHSTHDIPRIFITHDDMLEHPVATCQRLYDELTAHGVRRLAMPTAREIAAFITPDLYRSKPPASPYSLTATQNALAKKLQGFA